MTRFLRRHFLRFLVLITCVATASSASADKSAVKMTKLNGSVELSADGPTPFSLSGIASHLGNFTAVGEIEFVPGEEEGSLAGAGVAVFTAANGDRLVGEVTWDVDPVQGGAAASHLHFAWRDAVEFSDGAVATNTGHFTDNRPPGIVVIADGKTQTDSQTPNIIVLILITILRR